MPRNIDISLLRSLRATGLTATEAVEGSDAALDRIQSFISSGRSAAFALGLSTPEQRRLYKNILEGVSTYRLATLPAIALATVKGLKDIPPGDHEAFVTHLFGRKGRKVAIALMSLSQESGSRPALVREASL